MPAAAAVELIPLPPVGRRFTSHTTVRLGDVDPRGRMRLDAVARHLQDVAYEDAEASGLANAGGWLVRRTLIDVRWAPVFGEHLALTTFCSGVGRSWAERRTSTVGDRGATVEAVSLWVQVDPVTGRPAPLGDDFEAVYGEAAGGRRVSARLSLPDRPADGPTGPWTVRAADLDVFGHVNNAAQWAIVEERLAATGSRRTGVAEIEHLVPLDLDDSPATLHWSGSRELSVWLTVAGATRTAARWRPAERSDG